jgi:hypothetical protein
LAAARALVERGFAVVGLEGRDRVGGRCHTVDGIDQGATGSTAPRAIRSPHWLGNPVYDAANKTRIGRDQGDCVRTVVGKAWECFWTVLLPAGQITVEGPYSGLTIVHLRGRREPAQR